ncbi:hypothetical protein RO3G_17258 [Rhizopus delemar RA 99-880]|uniref:Uncharacterized protein n=1 Tax=Rhizopus delemar (strain RA 99-880 / ATCC MYA-4621 / FGSC 9543 / NRRL 43880) TaxID=246409 RepID=I1CVA7_RHIO9|nr:hypothetical protein RO3G_17258 [Rhizopus delemar RA 99-880]|eukprot:EIE92387.1 hypothetical protein RO3G_17258 [Rhizopus delemar RA 99-880]
MYWGAAKREARLKCDYSFKRSMDFIEAYSRCTDGREVVQEMRKFVEKKHLSHRKVRVSSDLV